MTGLPQALLSFLFLSFPAEGLTGVAMSTPMMTTLPSLWFTSASTTGASATGQSSEELLSLRYHVTLPCITILSRHIPLIKGEYTALQKMSLNGTAEVSDLILPPPHE